MGWREWELRMTPGILGGNCVCMLGPFYWDRERRPGYYFIGCVPNWWVLFYFIYFFRFYLFIDRGEGREKERERNINVWLPLMRPLLGTWPTTQACVLTENWTRNPLVRSLALNPLGHTSQGWKIFLFIFVLPLPSHWLCYYNCPIFSCPLFPSTLYPPSHPHSLPLVHIHVSYM